MRWATTKDVTGANHSAQIIDSSWQAVRPAVQGRELMEIAMAKQKTDLRRRANNLALVVDRRTFRTVSLQCAQVVHGALIEEEEMKRAASSPVTASDDLSAVVDTLTFAEIPAQCAQVD